MKIIFIVNPQSGKWLFGPAREVFCQIIKQEFPKAEIVFTQKKGVNSPKSLASLAQNEGFQIVVVRGGDGTVSNVVNGFDFSKPTPILGILPAGTGNDFAHTLGLTPLTLRKNLSIIKRGNVVSVDLGVVEFERETRFFVNTVSVGLDAEVNNRAHVIAPHLRRFWASRFAYVIAALGSMFHGLNPAEVTIEIDERHRKKDIILLAAVTNSFRYGGGFKINPVAKLDDGLLDLCVARPIKRLMIPYYMMLMKQARHCKSKVFSFYCFQQLVLESKTPLPVQIDGEEYPSQKHLKVALMPKALRVIAATSPRK